MILRLILYDSGIRYVELSVVEYETASIFTVERSRNCEELFSRFYRRLTMMDRRLRCGNVVCSDKKSRNGDSIRCCVSRDVGPSFHRPALQGVHTAQPLCEMWEHRIISDQRHTRGAATPVPFTYCFVHASNRSLNPVLIENVTVLMKGKEVVD